MQQLVLQFGLRFAAITFGNALVLRIPVMLVLSAFLIAAIAVAIEVTKEE